MKFFDRYHRVNGIQLTFNFPSLTEQHHKDDCDVNIILQRYMKTGVLPCETRHGVYGDFTGCASDYHEAVALIHDARERFESLPSAVRERFGNDPEQLLAFLDDPSNRKEAERLGLVATVTDAPDTRANDSNDAREAGAAAPGATAEDAK